MTNESNFLRKGRIILFDLACRSEYTTCQNAERTIRLIRAVIFDMGGTLLDFNPEHLPWLSWERTGLESAHAYLVARGYALPVESLIAHFIDALPERWQRATQGEENLKLGDKLRGACVACGVTPAPQDVKGAIARYIAPLDAQVMPFDDTLSTLETLCERGLRIGLVSNTMWPGEYHRQELDRFGLVPYLDHTVFSADVGIWKPQPGIYGLSLGALNVSAAEAVFVGDMPEHDIVGAQAAGMRGIYKRSASGIPDGVRPDATITHLAELPDLIDGW
jgi:putative hydrolase of the HAD superfamily